MSESTPTSEPASGNATSAPKSKPKKNLWMMIAAVAVAVILVSVVFLAVDWGGDDTDDDDDDDGVPPTMEIVASITPSGPVEAEAGETVMLTVSSEWKDVNSTESISLDSFTNVSYTWIRSPYDLGSFDLSGNRIVNFTVTDEEMTGFVNCTVEYEDVEEVVSIQIEVSGPGFASVTVVPVTKTLYVDTEGVFTAKAWDSVDAEMTGVDFEWTVFGLDEVDYDLNATTGPSVTFSPLDLGTGTVLLNVTGTLDDVSHSATSTITIPTEAAPERTVDYYWYDMFEIPLGEWYYERLDEFPWDGGPPYIYDWVGSDSRNVWNYTLMNLDITGANMPEINMNENSWFLPNMGTTQGGNAVLDWQFSYITLDEADEWPTVSAWYDGWISIMHGTTTLDEEATAAVLGMPSDEWDTFDAWWATNEAVKIAAWEQWMDDQGNVYYDIWPMYEWTLQLMVFELEAEKVGDSVVITHRIVSWGFEALMARWLSAAFMDDNEWYFEGFDMYAEIGPEMTDLDITTTVEYSAYAYATTNDGIECWMWEALAGDYVTTADSDDDDWISRYDVYADLEYLMLAPGSLLYGEMMTYDYAPGTFNLSEGETLRFTWPSGDQLFVQHIDVGQLDYVYGPMTVDWTEPMADQFPGQITVDTVARSIVFEGPIDMFAWSRDQTDAVNLAAEWDRLGVLPYGAPTIEFRLDGTAAALMSPAVDAAPGAAPAATAEALPAASVSPVTPTSAAAASASTVSEISVLVAVAVAMILVLLSMAQGARRMEKKR